MRFEQLNENHNLNTFNCGETSINEFLKKKALIWQNNNLTSCTLLIDNNNIIGFFTLSPSSAKRKYFKNIKAEEIPSDIPIVLLGMMGVDKSKKRKCIGSILLIEVLRRTYELYASSLKFRALGVDALNEKSANFFEYQGFYRIPDTKKLFLPIQDIEAQLKHHKLI